MFTAYLLALPLLTADPDPNPCLCDLERFSEVCPFGYCTIPREQASLCLELHDRLQYRLAASPWSAEREQALATLLHWRAFWGILEAALDTSLSDEYRLERLEQLQGMLGHHAYARGWHPPLLTEAMLPEVPRVEACCGE